MPDLAVTAFTGYTAVTGLVFLGMPAAQTLEIWPAAKGNAMAMEVGTVYCEVIGAFSLMLSVNTCPGPLGYMLSAMCWCAVMSKHMYVNELMPPPAVRYMGFGLLALTSFCYFTNKMTKVGKYAFLAIAALNAAVFFSDPKTPLLDTWPDLEANSVAMTIGLRSMDVIGTHFVAFVLMGCPGALGRLMAMAAVVALVAYHRTQFDIGPPFPVLVGIGVTFAVQAYAVLVGFGESKADKSHTE